MATLTEHLIHLNEKVAAQEDELETVKSFRVRCAKCKTWNTIGWLMTEGQNGQLCSGGNHPSGLNYA